MVTSYAMSHTDVYSPAHYAFLHSLDMEPPELIKTLVQRTNLSLLEVATKMDKASFQGTLHKFVHGNVPSPSRRTAEKIAKYFGLPTDAIYDAKIATRIAEEKGLEAPRATNTHALKVREEPAQFRSAPTHWNIAPELLARAQQLSPEHQHGLEAMIKSYIEAVAPARNRSSKAARA